MEQIVPQSAGSLSVAVLALMMAVVQTVFVIRKPQFGWYAWGAAASLFGMFYALGVFIEYNMPAGPVNRLGGLLEFSALLFLVHCLYGFTFKYLEINGKRYHIVAGGFHTFIFILLWSTNIFVSEEFVSRDFAGLAKPYVELGLGPLGAVFILYIVGSSIGATILWVRKKAPGARYRAAYLGGIVFWIALGIHDGLAAMGVPSIHYVMEYGFLGFSVVVLCIVFNSYTDVLAEDKYRSITDFANDGILVIQDGKTIFENPACRRLFGCSLMNSQAEDLVQNVAAEDREKLITYWRDVPIQGGGTSLAVRIERRDIEETYLEIRANTIQYRKRPAVLIVMRDITDRIHEEAARKDHEEKIARLKKMESLGLLAGGVAHDLNNVLSGIVSYPDLMLLNLPRDSELRKPLEAMQESGRRASAIVHDLLTIARGVAISKEPLNLNDIIPSHLTSPEYKRLLQYHSGVSIRMNLDSGLPNIMGSSAHIRKAVMNLVSNAAEAIRGKGTVVISTAKRSIDRPSKGYAGIPMGDYAVLIVEDDGQGISKEDIDRIFEPFYTKKVMGRSGTGLGLTVVGNVMQDHDGYIAVSSKIQGGAKFELYFPVTEEAVACKKTGASMENLQGSGEAILVVDDMESQRELSREMLEILGYQAVAVAGGEEAIDYLTNTRTDLILLDMIMDPGINGRETYERILKIHPKQKAVIVSGFAETDQVKQTLRLGASRFLQKPFNLDDLGRIVKEVLAE